MPRQIFHSLSTLIATSGVLSLLTAAQKCTAFTAPSLLVSQSIVTSISNSNSLHVFPSSFHDANIPSAFASTAQSSMVLIAAGSDDIGLEDAFQDSIAFTDGPVGVLVAAFAVFVVLAVGFKAVMSEMDGAIEKVLQDFEANLKRYYPKRWEAIEETSLAGLSGDERDIKLLKVMEELQRDDPEFMTKLANRSGSGPGVNRE